MDANETVEHKRMTSNFASVYILHVYMCVCVEKKSDQNSYETQCFASAIFKQFDSTNFHLEITKDVTTSF